MFTFTDLVFQAHPILSDATLANFEFLNGYGISVITGPYAYTSPSASYEAAVTKDGCYTGDTPIASGVVSNLTEHGVTHLMGQIVALPKPKE